MSRILRRIWKEVDEFIFGPLPIKKGPWDEAIDIWARSIVDKERTRPQVRKNLIRTISKDTKTILENELEEYRKARESCYYEILTLLLIGNIKELSLIINTEEKDEKQHKE